MMGVPGYILLRPHSTHWMGWFWTDLARTHQDRNDALWCAPLFMELVIGAGMVYTFGCMATDHQA